MHTNMHHFPRKTCFLCWKQDEPEDIVNVASWFLNIHNCFTIGPKWAEVQLMEN